MVAEKLTPLNRKLQLVYVGYRRRRMTLLDDLKPAQRQPSSDDLEMRVGQGGMITLQLLVHRSFDARSNDSIENEGQGEQACDQSDEERADSVTDPAPIVLGRHSEPGDDE